MKCRCCSCIITYVECLLPRKASGTAIALPKLSAGQEYQLGVDEAGATILTGGLVPAKCDDISKDKDRGHLEKRGRKDKEAAAGKLSKHRSRSHSLRSSKGKRRGRSKTPPGSPRGKGSKRSRSRGSIKSKKEQEKDDPAREKPGHVAVDPKLLKGMGGGAAELEKKPKETNETPPQQNSDVESLFAESPEPAEPKEPFLVKCAEGTWLVHIASDKMILLPKKDDWSVANDATKGDWVVCCLTNDKHTPHTVDKLLKSSRAVTYDEKTIADKIRIAKEDKAAAEEEEKKKKEAMDKPKPIGDADEEKKKEAADLAAQEEEKKKGATDKAKADAEQEEKKKKEAADLAAEQEKKKKEAADKAKADAEQEEKKKKEAADLAAEQEKKKEAADKAKADAEQEEKKRKEAADKAKADAEMNAELNKNQKASEKKKKAEVAVVLEHGDSVPISCAICFSH